MVGWHGELPLLEHAAREVPHDGGSLNMQVAEHFIRAPASKETDVVSVNLCAQQRHGACSPQGASRDVPGVEAELVWAQDGDGLAERSGDVGRLDGGSSVVNKIGRQGGSRRGLVGVQMKDPADEDLHRAQDGITAEAEADHFTADAVLLRGELESGKRGGLDGRRRCTCEVKAAGSNKKLDIAKPERSRVITGGARVSVLAGAE